MAKEYGYKINVKYGYSFDKEYNVFTDFVKTLYKTKVESENQVHRNISKSILNNLFGRFGMSIDKPITNIINNKTLDMVDISRRVINTIPLSDDSNLTTFDRTVSKLICEEFGVNYIKALETKLDIYSLGKDRKFNNVNIAISAAVNAYARIDMAKIKMDLLAKGYKIYYTDTDSLVIDKPLDDKLVGYSIKKKRLFIAI